MGNKVGLLGRVVVLTISFLTVLPAAGDSILLSSGLDVGTGCVSNCGNIDIGSSGGYEISDRQRLAQSFVLNAPSHVSGLEVAISAYSRNPTQVNVFLTDALNSSATTLAGESFYLNYPSTPQVLDLGTDLDLQPGVYYVLLTSLAGPESNPGGLMTESAVGSIGSAYYANSALGSDATIAGWQPYNSPTVGFELIGSEVSAVPEPHSLLLIGIGLIGLPFWKLPRS